MKRCYFFISFNSELLCSATNNALLPEDVQLNETKKGCIDSSPNEL